MSGAAPKTQLLNFDKNRISIHGRPYFFYAPVRYAPKQMSFLFRFFFVSIHAAISCPQVRKISRNFHSCINACDWSLILWENVRRKKQHTVTRSHLTHSRAPTAIKKEAAEPNCHRQTDAAVTDDVEPCRRAAQRSLLFFLLSLSIHFTCVAICIVRAMSRCCRIPIPIHHHSTQFCGYSHFIASFFFSFFFLKRSMLMRIWFCSSYTAYIPFYIVIVDIISRCRWCCCFFFASVHAASRTRCLFHLDDDSVQLNTNISQTILVLYFFSQYSVCSHHLRRCPRVIFPGRRLCFMCPNGGVRAIAFTRVFASYRQSKFAYL